MINNIIREIWNRIFRSEWINNVKNETDYIIANNVFNMPNEITFGIEIEIQMGSVAGEIILEKLKSKELTKQINICKFNEIGDYLDWKVIKEATCDYEVISPILHDDYKSWNEIETVCDILKSVGAITDKDCALHIHVGTKNLLKLAINGLI